MKTATRFGQLTRREVIFVLGRPTTTSGEKFPRVLQYDDIEMYFRDGYDGTLYHVADGFNSDTRTVLNRIKRLISDRK